MQLYLSEADHANVANLDLDDTVKMVVLGKVVSISRPNDMEAVPGVGETKGKSASLEIMIESMEIKAIDLQEALARAGEKEGLLVRNRIEAAP